MGRARGREEEEEPILKIPAVNQSLPVGEHNRILVPSTTKECTLHIVYIIQSTNKQDQGITDSITCIRGQYNRVLQ